MKDPRLNEASTSQGEMVERVARVLALRHAYNLAPSARDGTTPEQWAEAWWENFCDDARAAIEAMREPTQEMTLAGLIGLVTEIERLHGPLPVLTKAQIDGSEHLSPQDATRRYMHLGATMRCGPEIDEAFRSMIDAALNPPPGRG